MVAKRPHKRKATTPYRRRRLRDKNLYPKAQAGLLTATAQDLLGISDDQLSSMYQIAWNFLEEGELADAVRSFTFLCHLHPYVPDFWFGLGKALREYGEPEDALSMLFVAETMDPSRFEFYQEAIECCLQMALPKEAMHILHRLLAHRRTVESFPERKKEIRQLEERILTYKKTSFSTSAY